MPDTETSIIDATAPFTLTVTADDVAHATPGDDHACALAQAALRRKGIHAVSIGATTALIQRRDRIERYVLSPNDAAIIRAFDHSSIFPTISVTLLPPPAGRRLGDRKGQTGTDNRSGKHNTPRRHLTRAASRHVSRPT
jgi:hypothetical protein